MVCAHKLRRMQQFHLSFSSIDRLETSRGSVCQIKQPKLAIKGKIRPLLRNFRCFLQELPICLYHVIAHSFRLATRTKTYKNKHLSAWAELRLLYV